LLSQENTTVYRLTKNTSKQYGGIKYENQVPKRVYKKCPIESKRLIKHLPYCYYLIHLIVSRSKTIKNQYGYVNLRVELLDKVIPKSTRVMITSLLEELGVIEINNSYSSNPLNGFSKSYRINCLYGLDSLSYIDIDDRKPEIQRLTQLLNEANNIESNLNNPLNVEESNHNSDVKVTNIGSRSIILEENNHYCDNKITNIETIPNNRKGRKSLCWCFSSRIEKINNKEKHLLEGKTIDQLKFTEYRFQQDNIHSINLDYNSIEKDGNTHNLELFIEKVRTGEHLTINTNNIVNRVFTPINNLKKEYRKYLLCKNDRSLFEIDFKSSHAFHLIKEIKESENDLDLLLEVDELKNLAVTGDLYEYLVNHPKLECLNLDRDKAKELFIKSFLYGMYASRKNSKLINSIFPIISKYMTEIPRKTRSIQLQRNEAKLLNNYIIKRVADECPNCTLYGLFDAILIDEDHVDIVYNIMIEESSRFFGFKVPLSVKDWNSIYA
jgi:hypothetical protein